MNRKALIIATTLAAGMTAGAAHGQVVAEAFVSAMTHSQELHGPTVGEVTPACVATFHMPNRNSLRYRIRCINISNVTAAHIHDGDAQTAGPIIVGLFTGPTTGEVNGVLAAGRITRADLGEEAFDELLAKMRTDQTYVNVHTTANPAGEVRGQITGVMIPRGPALQF
jgi:hypothetical protein